MQNIKHNPRKHLLRLHEALYTKALQNARSYQAVNAPSILSYSKNFFDSLPNSCEEIDLDALLKVINKSRFIFYGDFHTLKQSQQELLKLISSFIKHYPDSKVILALEMFRAKDQAVVDEYLAGTITEDELLERINYRHTWGFLWDHYKIILDYAINHNIKIIAINTSRSGRNRLLQRDRFIANVLKKTSISYPSHHVFCMIGEYHLADAHLPRILSGLVKESSCGDNKITRILTNVDQYYFNNTHNYFVSPTEYLHLKDNLYCIINIPPWMKWQSYAIFEEMRSIQDCSLEESDTYHDDYDLYTEESFDIDFQIYSVIKELSAFLNLIVEKHQLSNFYTYVSVCDEILEKIKTEGRLQNRALTSVMERISLDGLYFVAQTNAFIITDVSLNNMAILAGRFLRNLLVKRRHHHLSPEERFISRILEYAAGIVAAKILNPRKRGKDIWYFQHFVKQNRRKKLLGHAKMKRDAAYALLKFHHWISLKIDKKLYSVKSIPEPIVKKDIVLHYEISKDIGEMLGYTLYARVMGHSAPFKIIKQLFLPFGTSKPTMISEFILFYEKIMH